MIVVGLFINGGSLAALSSLGSFGCWSVSGGAAI